MRAILIDSRGYKIGEILMKLILGQLKILAYLKMISCIFQNRGELWSLNAIEQD